MHDPTLLLLIEIFIFLNLSAEIVVCFGIISFVGYVDAVIFPLISSKLTIFMF